MSGMVGVYGTVSKYKMLTTLANVKWKDSSGNTFYADTLDIVYSDINIFMVRTSRDYDNYDYQLYNPRH